MDKYEYRACADEIRRLISEKEYEKAAEVADTVDWSRVKSLAMLCTVSDVYKVCRRYRDSKDVLLLAYRRHPEGPRIIFSLCELSILLGEIVQAWQYYEQYTVIAPNDSLRHVLLYKIYVAQEVNLDEKIKLLEELKKKDYRQKWAYELALLYHKNGEAYKCVAECDEIFAWWGEGRYVRKALELKEQHEPLTNEQKEKMDSWRGITQPERRTDQVYVNTSEEAAPEDEDDMQVTKVLPNISRLLSSDQPLTEEEKAYVRAVENADTVPLPSNELAGSIEVKPMDVSRYNTINLQQALAESMKQFLTNKDEMEAQSEDDVNGYDEDSADNDNSVAAEDLGATKEIVLPGEYRDDPNYNDGQGYADGQGYTDGQGYADGQGYTEGQGYEAEQGYADGQGYTDGQGYETEQGYADGQDYGTEQGYADGQDYGTEQGYADGQGYGAEQGYADGQGYTDGQGYGAEQSYADGQGYGAEQGYADGQGYTDGQGYGAEQGYADGQGYGTEQGYADGQGYETEQGYADGQGYGAEQGYADGQGYAAPQGNGVTRGNRGAHYYSKAEILQGLSPELQPASVMVEPMTQQDADAGTNDAYERAHEIMSLMKQDTDKIKVQGQKTADKIPGAKTGTLTPLNAGSTKLDGLLLQNVDGQITLNIPDSQKLIKQITGQMDIGDVLDEWERVKKENEKKRREEIKQRIMQSTSDIFSDFDEATRNGLLEQLERAYVESMSKDEAEGKKEYTPAQKRRNEREKNARIKAAAVKAAEEERSKHPDQFETEADDADGRYEEDSRDSADSYRDAGDARDDRDAGGDGRDADSRYEDEDIRGREDERASDREDRGYRDDRDDRDAGDYRDAGGRYEDADDGVTEGDAAGAVSEESEPERSRDRDRRKSGDDSRNRSRDKADDEEEVMRHVNEAIDAVEEADTGKKADAPKQKAERKAKAADAKRQALTPEEEELFGRFIKNGKERAQIIAALDRMSMAAYTGNVVLVGSKEAGTLDLAKNLLKQMRRQDSNFTGRIAKINGRNLAQKDDLQKIVSQARDGALIIEDAALMGEEKAKSFASALENTNDGILVIMTDRKERLRQLFAHVQSLKKMFDIRINVRPMDDDALVEYARDYAESRDCTIDEFGFLALHERIAEMQTADHEVTPSEIRDVVDEAIYWAEKKNLSYFWNTVLGRRYDENDMVILKEKDFQHYR